MNNVQLIGRLTKDVELRYTQNGKAVGNFTLAVQRKFKDQNGNYQADFIQCTIWGKTAENLAQYQKKGAQIGATGSIETGSYEKDGRKVFTTKVNVQSVDFLEHKNNQNGGQGGNQAQNSSYNQGGGQPQGNPYNQNQGGNSYQQQGQQPQGQNNQQGGGNYQQPPQQGHNYQQNQGNYQNGNQQPPQGGNPWQQQNGNPQGGPVDINDDDLPF